MWGYQGIGTMLIDALVGQIGADISYTDNGGCSARVLIPKEQFNRYPGRRIRAAGSRSYGETR
jgi:hypothetical protein